MKHRLTGPSTLLAIVLIAGFAVLLGACTSGGGGGGGRGTPTPAPTPLVGCNTGANSIAIAGAPLGIVRRLPERDQRSTYIPGRVAVKFTGNGSEPEIGRAMIRLQAKQIAPPGYAGYILWSIAEGQSPQTAAASLVGTRGIADAMPLAARYMQTVPDDPEFGMASQLSSGPQIMPVQWDMYITNMPATWTTYMGSSSVTIAIIDTGYDANNVDICQKVLGSAVFDLGNGTEDTSATVQDTDGHGSNVSGIAAASTNNMTRFAGVGWSTSLLEVRVFPKETPANPNPSATNLDVAAGINWAVAHGASVINLSLGAQGKCDPQEQAAITAAYNAGVTVVVASGNDSKGTISSPANCNFTIAVGASAIDDTTNPSSPTEKVASYSNYGAGLTLVAPGGDPSASQFACTPGIDCDYLQWIINNYSTTACNCPKNKPGHEVLIAGTSQATPHVAGVAAMIYAKRAGQAMTTTRATIFTILNSPSLGADDIGGGVKQGAGRLNAQKALTNA